MHYIVIEDNTVRINGILSDDGFVCVLPDAADKKLICNLPLVKVVMRLMLIFDLYDLQSPDYFDYLI